eukprot:8720810-Alexandrium_andersonii.AAC.1
MSRAKKQQANQNPSKLSTISSRLILLYPRTGNSDWNSDGAMSGHMHRPRPILGMQGHRVEGGPLVWVGVH